MWGGWCFGTDRIGGDRVIESYKETERETERNKETERKTESKTETERHR